MKQKILIERHYVLFGDVLTPVSREISAYYNAFLLVHFGIQITNPEYVDEKVFKSLTKVFNLEVPSSFYANPQDTKYFYSDELLIEQVVSYIFGYGTPLGRLELFEKKLPEYLVGDEVRLRTYKVIDNKEADEILKEVSLNLCAYKRPFSLEEREEFLYLIDEGYVDLNAKIECKDNIFLVLDKKPELANDLDQKDLVKFSIQYFGEQPDGIKKLIQEDEKFQKIFLSALSLVKSCPLSKKQAKYLNKLISSTGADYPRVSNANNPYRLAKIALDNCDVLKAAQIYQKSGALLLRNIKMLASRCTSNDELLKLFEMLPNDNPVVMFQIYSSLDTDIKDVPRTFKFSYDNINKTHVETDEEAKYRKSVLSDDVKKQLKNILYLKLISYYSSLPKLGKIYISDFFSKVALPINTSSSGNGIDVLPSGSRIKFDAQYLRTFCYWDGIRDIDASLMVLTENDYLKNEYSLMSQCLSWQTYYNKPFEEDALCSGDCTSTSGAEYQDIRIKGLLDKGYRYAISCLNGYGARFDAGTAKAGIQIKNNLDTSAWDPKNIEFEMNVRGDCSSFTCFAIDLLTKEIIIVNAKSNYGQIIRDGQINVARNYLSESYLNFNMKTLLSCLGKVVNDPEEADYVFDNDYQGKDHQTVVRAFDIPSLIKFVNLK